MPCCVCRSSGYVRLCVCACCTGVERRWRKGGASDLTPLQSHVTFVGAAIAEGVTAKRQRGIGNSADCLWYGPYAAQGMTRNRRRGT